MIVVVHFFTLVPLMLVWCVESSSSASRGVHFLVESAGELVGLDHRHEIRSCSGHRCTSLTSCAMQCLQTTQPEPGGCLSFQHTRMHNDTSVTCTLYDNLIHVASYEQINDLDTHHYGIRAIDSIAFSGTVTSLVVVNSVIPNLPELTVSACIYIKKFDTVDSDFAHIISYATNDDDNAFLIEVKANNLATRVNNKFEYFTLQSDLLEGKWYCLLMSWSSSHGLVNMSIDGKTYTSSNPVSTDVIPGSGWMVMGQDQDEVLGGYTPTQAVNGAVSEMNMWSTDDMSTTLLSQLELVQQSLRQCGGPAGVRKFTGNNDKLIIDWRHLDARLEEVQLTSAQELSCHTSTVGPRTG